MTDRQLVLLANTPASACRIPIFAPTRRPQAVTAWRVETSWGWAAITGRLGQQHRDVLDGARMVAEREEFTSDGRFHLLVDPARLRSALGGDAVNMQRINDWLRDLKVAQVEAHINKSDTNISGGLISDVVDAATLAPDARPGAFKSERRMWLIHFGLAWSKLVDDDIAMKYPLRQVVGLKHGFSQAVARYCLSHTNVRDTVEGLAQKLNAGGRLRVRRGELAEDASGLAAMGITITGDKITAVRQQSPVGRTQSPVPASKVR